MRNCDFKTDSTCCISQIMYMVAMVTDCVQCIHGHGDTASRQHADRYDG